MDILNFDASHYPEVAAIYLEGIATGLATFETNAPDWEAWDSAHLKTCRLAAVEEGELLGWAALSPVSSRCVYGGVAEVSVYVSAKARGKGVGKALLNRLILESEKNDIWTLQSGIFRENVGSRKLHEACGFRLIGHKEKIGKLKGKWLDNMLYERRSKVIGV